MSFGQVSSHKHDYAARRNAPVESAWRACIVEVHHSRKRKAVQQPVTEACPNRDKANK